MYPIKRSIGHSISLAVVLIGYSLIPDLSYCQTNNGTNRDFRGYYDAFNREKCGKRPGFGKPDNITNSPSAFCPSVPPKQRPSLDYYSVHEAGQFPSWAEIELRPVNYGTSGGRSQLNRCGGVLISPNVILTSAACFSENGVNYDAGFVRVGMGHGDLTVAQKRFIKAYCATSPKSPNRYFQGMALVITDRAFEYTDWVQPACLMEDKPLQPKTEVYWALNLDLSTEGSRSRALLERNCEPPFANYNLNGDACYQQKNMVKDICLGKTSGSVVYTFDRAKCDTADSNAVQVAVGLFVKAKDHSKNCRSDKKQWGIMEFNPNQRRLIHLLKSCSKHIKES